jgi:hypothetical protein
MDGDFIDCVDINQQPAFDHPLLKNHTIQVSLLFFLTLFMFYTIYVVVLLLSQSFACLNNLYI